MAISVTVFGDMVKAQMGEVKNFGYNPLISQKEYLDKFIYKGV